MTSVGDCSGNSIRVLRLEYILRDRSITSAAVWLDSVCDYIRSATNIAGTKVSYCSYLTIIIDTSY